MAEGDMMPMGHSHKKKPLSRQEIERRRKIFRQVPNLQRRSEEAAQVDQARAEDLLDDHVF